MYRKVYATYFIRYDVVKISVQNNDLSHSHNKMKFRETWRVTLDSCLARENIPVELRVIVAQYCYSNHFSLPEYSPSWKEALMASLQRKGIVQVHLRSLISNYCQRTINYSDVFFLKIWKTVHIQGYHQCSLPLYFGLTVCLDLQEETVRQSFSKLVGPPTLHTRWTTGFTECPYGLELEAWKNRELYQLLFHSSWRKYFKEWVAQSFMVDYYLYQYLDIKWFGHPGMTREMRENKRAQEWYLREFRRARVLDSEPSFDFDRWEMKIDIIIDTYVATKHRMSFYRLFRSVENNKRFTNK